MDILILGGTRYFGVHLVRTLLREGHGVTIATRGQQPDAFGDSVRRIQVERTSAESLHAALWGRSYDVVYDNLAYCSNDVRALLDVVRPGMYVMTSSASVYENLGPDTKEGGFDPLAHPLVWCDREAYKYNEVKRQAECALFQAYPAQRSTAVRFPFVIGPDDYTERLYFYVEHIVRQRPMHVDNLDARMGFVSSRDAGGFLASLKDGCCPGPVNGSNPGTVSLREVFEYVRKKTGKQSVLVEGGEPAPYNGAESYSLSGDYAAGSGYAFAPLNAWLPALLDAYIARAEMA